MRPLLLVVLALLLLTPATSLAWGENNIGLYTTPTPYGAYGNHLLVAPGPGLYEVYLVCTKPINQHTGADILTIGGFELNLVMPDGWFINGVTLPPDVLDFNSANNAFYCAGNIPVNLANSTGMALLATVTLATFLENLPPAGILIEPSFAAPSIPGHMAITDADDAFSISQAYPSSGEYTWPIMGINWEVVPTEDQSWGGVKALFQ